MRPSTDASADRPRGSFDVAVVGSGGAGLVAACVAADLNLTVVVLEASRRLGGTTALSGGQMWVPCSAPMARGGFEDSPGQAVAYLRRVTCGSTPTELLESFVEDGPKFVDYMEGELGLPVVSIDRPDYHPDWEGAAVGRSLEPLPVPTTEIASWRDRIRTSPHRRPVTGPESRSGLAEEEVHRREASDVRTQGAGLVAGLVRAAVRRGVRLEVEATVTAVARGQAGSYVLTVDGASQSEVYADVLVLAAGGFARSKDLRHDFLPPVDIVPTCGPGSTGDSLRLGLALGGRLRGMSEAWWTPAVAVPGETVDGEPLYRNIVRELAYPGSILVNASGRRFADEASSYNDLAKAFLAFDPQSHIFSNEKAWLVFDSRFKYTRTVAGIRPHEKAEWIFEAPDLDILASRAGMDPLGLSQTVAAFNRAAAEGSDPEFGRGSNSHDRHNGDASHRPNPCLAPLTEAPFFAVPVHIGANGTKGGLTVDSRSRVLGLDGEPVEGLFAVGEAAAALMGPGYAGSGASLGPSLTAAWSLKKQLQPNRPDTGAGADPTVASPRR
jgi:succinate dehydrogenase/fumarate reductase flavoprotein subunit